MKRTILWFIAALAVALMIEWTRPAPACGPFYFPPVFTEVRHPDIPVLPYTRGQLGVIEPTYNRIYLYIAYRDMVGPGFSSEEARALWGGRMDLLGQSEPMAPPSQPRDQQNETDWARAWIDARNRVPISGRLDYLQSWDAIPGIFRQETGPDNRYSFYLNCPQQAFRTALATLQDRTQKYGVVSSDLAAWVRAQDQVFSNCPKGENIPAPLAADVSPLAREDRQYQIAAAYFYAGDFAHAVDAFREIAGDTASPWSAMANYLGACRR